MSIVTKVLKKIKYLIKTNIFSEESEKYKVLLAQNMAVSKNQLTSIDDFRDVEFSCFSQWGEDGIINWLISKLPNIPKKFIEFGVGNYKESNTRLLLQLHNWQGLVMDSTNDYIQDIKSQDISWRHQLDSVCAHISKDNINQLLENRGMTSDIGLLSIDIDGNDYFVWQSINIIQPIIVIVEYNAVLGDLHPITIPYKSDFFRTKAHSSNLYFGASLKALITLGKKKGYTFVGTNTNGVNAFFIRDDFAPMITSLISSISAYPSLSREARNADGKLNFISGLERLEIIRDCKILNLETNEVTKIDKLGKIYSAKWQVGKKNNYKD